MSNIPLKLPLCVCLPLGFKAWHVADLWIVNVPSSLQWLSGVEPRGPISHPLPFPAMNQILCSFMKHCPQDMVSYSSLARGEMPSFETLSAEMESLKRHLSQIDSPTVLCHNDLLTKNIIYDKNEGRNSSAHQRQWIGYWNELICGDIMWRYQNKIRWIQSRVKDCLIQHS